MVAKPSADTIIKNVNVITMNRLHPFANGIAIANGKIIGLLSEDTEEWPLSSDGVMINGKGRTVIPGLIDAHCHLRAQISHYLSVPCDRHHVTSIDDIIEAVHKRANPLPSGRWVRAIGYDPYYLKEQRHPTRWDLDKATTTHPVRIRHITRHASVLNSMALSLAGFGSDTVDPPGVTIERDPKTNSPTGLIFGGDAWLSKHVVSPLTDSEIHSGIERLHSFLLSKGITAVQDATPTNTPDDVRFWAERIEANQWSISIQLMSGQDNHHNMTNLIKNDLPEQLTDVLQMGPMKVVIEAYPELNPTPSELVQLAVDATRRQIPLAIHVVNPEMTWAAIEAIRHSSKLAPGTSLHHRLEHLSLCPEAFLDEIAELGIMVVTNPGLIHDHGDRYLTDVDRSEHSWLYRMNSLLNAGIPLAAGSDAPVASFDPWVGIQTACSRSTSSGKLVSPEERVGRWEALEMYTSNAARAAGWEQIRGMIYPGYQADLLFSDDNPLTCPLESLTEIQVSSTWIRGELVYQKNSNDFVTG